MVIICFINILLDYYAQKKGVILNMADYLQMRKYPAAYLEFFQRFVREVIGKRRWDDIVKWEDKNTFLKIVTPSDEALALVLYENIEARALDICQRTKGKLKPPKNKSDEKSLEDFKSKVPYKWTTQDTILKRNFWGEKGIGRFNKLRDMVQEDRAVNPRFMTLLWGAIMEEKKDNSPKPTRKRKKSATVEPANDLELEDEDNEPMTTTTAKTAGTASDHDDSSTDIEQEKEKLESDLEQADVDTKEMEEENEEGEEENEEEEENEGDDDEDEDEDDDNDE